MKTRKRVTQNTEPGSSRARVSRVIQLDLWSRGLTGAERRQHATGAINNICCLLGFVPSAAAPLDCSTRLTVMADCRHIVRPEARGSSGTMVSTQNTGTDVLTSSTIQFSSLHVLSPAPPPPPVLPLYALSYSEGGGGGAF
jgi:hypothetical protein